MLFQIDVAGGAPVEIYPEFWREHEVEDEVRSFAEQLVEASRASASGSTC